LLKTLLAQTVVLLTVFVPQLTAPLVTLATGALAPVGLAGLARLAAVLPAPPVAPPTTSPAPALAPSIPTSTSSPAPAPVEASAPAATPGSPPPSAATPPTVTGAGIGAGMGAGMENFAYLVGDLSAVAGAAAAGRAQKRAPEAGGAEAPAVAPTPKEPAQTQRRRRARAQMLGRGYEYMDLEDLEDGADSAARERFAAVAASVKGAGTQGFAGTAAKTGAGQATGLATLADDAFGGGPRMPMIPGTWSADSTTHPESEPGDDG
jgi:PPE-repeat protein